MVPGVNTGSICKKFKRIHLTKPAAPRPGAARPTPTPQELNPFLHTPEEYARLRCFYTECATWPRPGAVEKERRNSEKARCTAAAKMRRRAAAQRKASMKLRKKLMRRAAVSPTTAALVRLQSPPPPFSSPFAPQMAPQVPAVSQQQQQQRNAAIRMEQARVLRFVKRAKVNAQLSRYLVKGFNSTTI